MARSIRHVSVVYWVEDGLFPPLVGKNKSTSRSKCGV